MQFRENAKRFRWALEMLGRQRNTAKTGIFAVFGPKPWTPTRRPENGPAASFDDQPNGRVSDTRPDSDFRFFGPRDRGPGSRLRESLRVFLASFGGPARSDQGVSEAVAEPAMAVLFPFRGSPRPLFLSFFGPAGSVQGVSEVLQGPFRESVRPFQEAANLVSGSP